MLKVFPLAVLAMLATVTAPKAQQFTADQMAVIQSPRADAASGAA